MHVERKIMSHKAKSASTDVPESFYLNTYHTRDLLPPMWEIVYQEAIRGNHILFDDADVDPDTIVMQDASFQGDGLTKIEDVLVQMLASSDLTQIRAMIAGLSQVERQALFLIYKNLIQATSSMLKAQLH